MFPKLNAIIVVRLVGIVSVRLQAGILSRKCHNRNMLRKGKEKHAKMSQTLNMVTRGKSHILGEKVNAVYTRGVQKIRGQMLPFPQFLTEQRETFT